MTETEIRGLIRAAAKEANCKYRITSDGVVNFYDNKQGCWIVKGWDTEYAHQLAQDAVFAAESLRRSKE